MKEVIIRIKGQSALQFIAAGQRDLEEDILPNKLGVKKEDLFITFN